MKRILFTLLVSLFSLTISAQSTDSDVKVGDVFVIANVSNDNYKHINFPRTNFIIKKGGIANYNNVKGKEVVITSIKEKNDGSMVATIKLSSGKFFFNSHKFITVDIVEAIDQKELLKA